MLVFLPLEIKQSIPVYEWEFIEKVQTIICILRDNSCQNWIGYMLYFTSWSESHKKIDSLFEIVLLFGRKSIQHLSTTLRMAYVADFVKACLLTNVFDLSRLI